MENKEKIQESDKEWLFSRSVRAGKRTYFFDVKNTKDNDYFITITESKKMLDSSGQPFFERHKVFLYREDFVKFVDGLNEALHFANVNVDSNLLSTSSCVHTEIENIAKN